MFLFPPIFEASIVTVADPGVPNKERIVIRPTQTVNLGQFGMTAAVQAPTNPNLVIPLMNSFFWFPSYIIEPPSWVFLYTGAGKSEVTTLAGTSETAYVFHWDSKTTIFGFRDVVPVMFRLSGMLIGVNPSTEAFPNQLPLPPVPSDAGRLPLTHR